MINQQTITKYHQLSSQIAAALSCSWTPSQPQREDHADYAHRHQYLADADGRTLILIFDGWQNKGRISVTGKYPRYANNQIIHYDHKPEITVSQSRPIASIAADITRRFLPKFQESWDYCRDIQQKHGKKVQITRQHIRAIFQHTKARPHWNGFKTIEEIKDSCTNITHPKTGTIQIFADGHATIERASVTDVETLIEILRLLEE